MGNTAGFENERPEHIVTVSKPFYLSQTPITVAQFSRFVEVTQYQTSAELDGVGCLWMYLGANSSEPVRGVSWIDACYYAKWLSASGGMVRLPTEAEWEYACQAHHEIPLDERAWYQNNARGRVHRVAQKQANGFGLYDMLGNVAEWTQDDFQAYSTAPRTDPIVLTNGSVKVLKGGSYAAPAEKTTPSVRGLGTKNHYREYSGFRVLKSFTVPADFRGFSR
ncbi:MAG: formylglycine-generating enzyme family protein [Gammaproteobacteria bacterium]|nr:formylglycine-generating enzyme family protein [Gammaproteobacteria bacterium]